MSDKDHLSAADSSIASGSSEPARPTSPAEDGEVLACLPCCGYYDGSAVMWNPWNKVVQCHNCGQSYAPQPIAGATQEPQ